MNLPLDELIVLSSPTEGGLNRTGMLELNRFVECCGTPNPGGLFQAIGRDWKVAGTQDYVGTLPKRVSNWLYRNHRIRLDAEQRAELGQLCKRHIADSQDTVISFTATFDWDDGDFGDDGSCLWHDNESALRLMEYYGFLAIKLYDERVLRHPGLFNSYGKGRAWVVPGTGKNGVPKDSFIVFNGYNTANDSCGDPTLDFARYLADYTNMVYKKVQFTVQQTSNGVVWVNTGRIGGDYLPKGFLVSTVEVVDSFSHSDVINFKG